MYKIFRSALIFVAALVISALPLLLGLGLLAFHPRGERGEGDGLLLMFMGALSTLLAPPLNVRIYQEIAIAKLHSNSDKSRERAFRVVLFLSIVACGAFNVAFPMLSMNGVFFKYSVALDEFQRCVAVGLPIFFIVAANVMAIALSPTKYWTRVSISISILYGAALALFAFES